jgi:16S rRNA (cytidine1402-2'-O)-methyltransferase
MGNLYIVPTPIGNLEDITLRALRMLREVALIAAEDTRTTRRLLDHFDIKTPLTSYHEHNKLSKLEVILGALQVGDVALVSDAGMPGLSDPGYELIQAAIEHAAPIIPLPGPSALLPALVASGLPTDNFSYLGFLPRKARLRQEAIQAVSDFSHTLVIYEAPHRLLETLNDLYHILGERRLAVARELSKLHEEIWRGVMDEAIEYFGRSAPRGEFVLVIAGAPPQAEQAWTEEQVRQALAAMLAAGEARSTAARAIAEKSGWPRRAVYDLDVG